MSFVYFSSFFLTKTNQKFKINKLEKQHLQKKITILQRNIEWRSVQEPR